MTIKEIEIQLALGTLSDNMKIKIANNLNTPEEILIKLSKDEDWLIRKSVANNLNTSEEILIKLSEDNDWFVKFCARSNRLRQRGRN